MILLAAVWFIPIYYLIVTTFKNPQEATQSPLGLPKVWVFQNYVDAFVNMQYPRALFNTVKITVLAVAIIVLVTSMAGYALARTKSRWGNRIFLLFLRFELATSASRTQRSTKLSHASLIRCIL